MRRELLIASLVVPVALLAAGCGDDETTASTSSEVAGSTTERSATDATAARVQVASTELGDVLVDGDGMTLYAFTPDSETKSTCTGSCATTWPPATTDGSPSAEGVDEVTVIERDDGTTQVVVAGHPLYTYSADSEPGDTNGQGQGGKWFAIAADGTLVKSDDSTDKTTTTDDGY